MTICPRCRKERGKLLMVQRLWSDGSGRVSKTTWACKTCASLMKRAEPDKYKITDPTSLTQSDVQGLGPGEIRKVPQKEIERIYQEETGPWLKTLTEENRRRMEEAK